MNMETDIVQRLRQRPTFLMYMECANEIERLRVEIRDQATEIAGNHAMLKFKDEQLTIVTNERDALRVALNKYESNPAPTVQELTHTDHPMRNWDRTCPACNPAVPEDGPCKQHQFVTTFGGDFCIKCNEPAPSNEHPSYDDSKANCLTQAHGGID